MSRIQKRHGHAEGGPTSWRNYGTSITALKTPRAQMLVGSGESWWTAYAQGPRGDEAFMTEIARRFPMGGRLAC